MIDIVNEIAAIQRKVGEGQVPSGPARVIHLQRDFDASIEDVWDALTDPERLGRWFLPITGDYRLGGDYQFEGNAGGKIVACERPERLKVTWAYGVAASDADVSEVEVRLSKLDDASTRLDFEHTSVVPDEMWSEYGPGAVGVGWDQGVLGLARHLHGDPPLDPAAWPMSAEGRSFFGRSSQAWGAANKAAGADPATVARNITNTTAFYAPDPEAT